MRIVGKKRDIRENIAVRKQWQTYGFFFFLGEKNKNFWEHLYEWVKLCYTPFYTHAPKVTQIITCSHDYC